MKKRLLNLFLVMLMVACVLPMAANAASCSTHNKNNTTHVAAKAATCMETGNIEHWKCEACGKTFVAASTKPTSTSLKGKSNVTVPVSSEHNFTVDKGYRTGDEPTCTETGIRVLGCSVTGCTATTAQTAPVVECEKEWLAKKDATCTEKGHESGWRCKWCHKIIDALDEISAKGHSYGEPVVVTAPTCTKSGTSRKTCTVCGSTRIEYPAKIDHKLWPKTKVEPTCVEPGREAGKQCEYCKEFIEGGAVIPVVDHTRGKMIRYIKHPTCQETGEAEYECTVEGCEATIKLVIRKLNCNIVDLAAKAPTCNNTGLTAGKTCTICDDTTKDQNCAYCAGIKVEQEEVDSLGHDQVLNKNHKDYVAATCDEGGVDVWDCTRCGYDGHKVNTKELGHDWDISVLKEATCTIKGMAFYQCKREGCGDWKYVNIDKLGHNKVTVPAVEPTCTATGLTAGEKCDRCNQTFTAQSIVDKLAHAWEDVEAKDPTCEEDGYNAHRACANCDETDGMTVIPAGAAYHNYVNNKCTICEEYDPDHDHEGTGVVTTASTCTTAGVKTFECDTCDYSWTEAVTKAAHVYGADDRCNACDALNPEHQHTYVQTGSRAPTCTVEGKTTNRCSVCGDQTETLVNAIGHSYANGRCVNCGNPAACEHDNVSSTLTAATCSRAGREVFTCDDCGATVVDRTIAATGKHTYSNNYCTGCGKADPNKITVDKQGVYIVG